MVYTDHNLLFGVIAMQCDLIDREQFVDASTLWASRKEISLSQVLLNQGWLTRADVQYVESLLAQRVRRRSARDVEGASAVPAKDAQRESVRTIVLPPPSAPERPVKRRGLAHAQAHISLHSLHSAGGIGEIWRARDHILNREVALKKLKPKKKRSAAHRERFYREACITGQLDHPGVVPVYGYYDHADDEACFYTMRFVQGRTLSEVIDEYHHRRVTHGRSAVTGEFLRLLGYFLSVCNTLAFAHSRRVIHRDLKGENIIVGDFGEVVVLDWGVAKRLSDTQSEMGECDVDDRETVSIVTAGSVGTMQGVQLGTPVYMAPEQAQGRIDLIDYRTDVYGLAALLYEILTGRPPFGGDTITEVLRNVVSAPAEPPDAVVSGVPGPLVRACLKGLQKERSERQQTVAELATEVQDWLTMRAERKRAELERERFFDLSLDLLAILEQDDRLAQSNAAWERVLGWTNTDLSNASLLQYVVSDDVDAVRAQLMSVWSRIESTEFECRCRCRDGTYRWLHWSARQIPGEEALYLVGRDITERKHSEQKFQGILESAPDAMCVVDDSGAMVLINAQFEKLFGFPREELLGHPLDVLIPVPLRARHSEQVARFFTNPTARPMAAGLELSGRRRDGTVFPVEISLSPVKTEEGLLVSCAIRPCLRRSSAEDPTR